MIVIDRKSRAGATAPQGTSHDRIRNHEQGSLPGPHPITRKGLSTAVEDDEPPGIRRAGRDIPRAGRTKGAEIETAPELALEYHCLSVQL